MSQHLCSIRVITDVMRRIAPLNFLMYIHLLGRAASLRRMEEASFKLTRYANIDIEVVEALVLVYTTHLTPQGFQLVHWLFR